MLVRVAPTFIRFGSLQLAAKRQGVASVVEIARFVLEKIASLESKDDDSGRYLHRAQLYGGAAGIDHRAVDGSRAVRPLLQPGDALVIGPYIVHGSAPNRTASRWRPH